MSRRSALVVTRNFPPLTGGMERLMKHSTDALARDYELTIIGPSGCAAFSPSGARVLECPPHPALFLVCALLKGLFHCLTRRYAVVFGGSGLVAPVTLILARIAHGSSLVLVHGLDLVVDSAIYQRFFVAAIRRHDLVVANSTNTRDLAIAKGCDPGRTEILHPGCSIPSGGDVAESTELAASLGLAERGVCLFVGRMIRRKGLAPFLREAWPKILESTDDAILVAVGDSPDDAAMRDPGGGREIQAAIELCPSDSVRFLGSVDDNVLRQCYARADCLVFPLIPVKGDVEGFGMVAIEAAAHGTPTVAFAEGGVVDAVDAERSGYLVAAGDYDAFAAACVDMLQGGGPAATACREFATGFSWDRHAEKLLSLVGDQVKQ
jgi:phosphatidylinositol alpha-1,6-mannosyltransferase